ncbi:MAG: phosphatidylglycerol lysyltransferase domain-containing protein, partial [Syntrophaceticus sp.]|nr:phosphatidylglycerol lysyltransferase domain-containing protein [Syntrophaceticus sp.]
VYMIDFKEVEIEDKRWIDPLLAAADMGGCQYNFTNLFAWANTYQYRVAQVEDFLVVKGILDGTQYYFYPAGQGDPQPVIERLAEDAADSDVEFVLVVSKENKAELNRLFPEKFELSEMRDSFDYVYDLEKLVTLSGKKYRGKRNHVNYFKKNYSWSFEQMTTENLDECWEMNAEWCKINKYMGDAQLTDEYYAVRRCFEHFEELGLDGGLLRAEGRVIAYTIGDKLNSDTYDIHIEKAFGEIKGAYQTINQQFATFIQEKHPEMIFVNREEDMGQAGLRKSKLSYYPVRMEEKYWGQCLSVGMMRGLMELNVSR